jgi:glyoxylase I family protein
MCVESAAEIVQSWPSRRIVLKKQRREFLTVVGGAAGAAMLPGAFATVASGTEQTAAASQTAKEAVTGIGGFFFRAHDPKALQKWYQDNLGVSVPVWKQEAGKTSFTAFSETTKYFGSDLTKQWMINFRVNDLEKMAAQLQAAGITVKVDPEASPYGRFAHLNDPEGNPIELWQPENPTPSK